MTKQFIIILIGLSVVVVAAVLLQKDSIVSEQDIEMQRIPLVTEDVAYFDGATGYYVQPATEGVYPGVVMIHENRGLRPEIKTAAEELAAEGYQVLAVDLYGVVMETQDEARAFGATYDEARGVENMRAAVAFLRERNATGVASLGWCFGGAQSLALSTAGESLDATVIYYGRLPSDAAALTALEAPVLGIFGDQDQVVPVESVDAFKAALASLNIENEIYLYEGVGHAFANPSNPNFAPEPTADAWQKTLAFLERHLK